MTNYQGLLPKLLPKWIQYLPTYFKRPFFISIERADSLSIAFNWSKCNSIICLHYFLTFCLLSLLCSFKSNPPKEVYILEADFVQPLKSLLFSWTSQPQAVKSSSFCFLRYWHTKEYTGGPRIVWIQTVRFHYSDFKV